MKANKAFRLKAYQSYLLNSLFRVVVNATEPKSCELLKLVKDFDDVLCLLHRAPDPPDPSVPRD